MRSVATHWLCKIIGIDFVSSRFELVGLRHLFSIGTSRRIRRIAYTN